MTAIAVYLNDGKYVLIYGAHRVLAARKLGWTHINAVVLENITPAGAELLGLQENLGRSKGFFCVLEEAYALAREKELYEKLYPGTKWGGDRSNRSSSGNNGDLTPVSSFADKTAKDSDHSPRWVRKMVRIGQVLGPVRETLFDTWICDRFLDLEELSEMEVHDRICAIQLLTKGQASSMKELRRLMTTRSPEHVKAIRDLGSANTLPSTKGQRMIPEECSANAGQKTLKSRHDLIDPSLLNRIMKIEKRLAELEDIPGLLVSQMNQAKEKDQIVPTDADLWCMFFSANDIVDRTYSLKSNIYSGFKCPKCTSRHLVASKVKCTNCGEETWWG